MEPIQLEAVVRKTEMTDDDKWVAVTIRVSNYRFSESTSYDILLTLNEEESKDLRVGQDVTIKLEPWEMPDGETVCDLCGDHSNSEPGLKCGRSSDDEGNPPYCQGTYREKEVYRTGNRACPVFVGDGPVCDLCGKYRIAHSDKALDNAG